MEKHGIVTLAERRRDLDIQYLGRVEFAGDEMNLSDYLSFNSTHITRHQTKCAQPRAPGPNAAHCAIFCGPLAVLTYQKYLYICQCLCIFGQNSAVLSSPSFRSCYHQAES